MSVAVEHEKRKREILEKALDVFVESGYEDTTFQKIAERCGITRTILYLYFKNKREIFAFSIKLFTERLETEIRGIARNQHLPVGQRLVTISAMIVDLCAREARLLNVMQEYLRHLRAQGGDAADRVRRRTIRMRHILTSLIIEGQRIGEFRAFPVAPATEFFYSLMEAAIFRIAILGKSDASGLASASAFVSGLMATDAHISEAGLRASLRKAKAIASGMIASESSPDTGLDTEADTDEAGAKPV